MSLFRNKDEDVVYDPNDDRLDFNILYSTHVCDPNKYKKKRPRRYGRNMLLVLLLLLMVVAISLLL